MIHVLTVHWRTDRWIAPQLRYLQRNMTIDYQVLAVLNDLPREQHERFDLAVDIEGSHAEKLNALARLASERADARDHFLFLDGDAFPIAPVDGDLLEDFPLCAIRRDENLGDLQPHPSFCLTTAAFWNEIAGDWRAGDSWTNSLGQRVTDVGGRLMGALARRQIAWKPLLRSNRLDLHPVWFGVYGGIVYHHGAGFRPHDRVERADSARKTLSRAVAAASVRAPDWLPSVRRVERSVRVRAAARRRRRFLDTHQHAQEVADIIYRALLDDPEFFRLFSHERDPASSRIADLGEISS